MENIINWVILIASFLTAITTICMFCRKAINKGFEPIYGRIDKIDENQCRNFLVDFLAVFLFRSTTLTVSPYSPALTVK